MSFPGIAQGFTDQGKLEPSKFIAGDFPRVTRLVVLISDAPLPVGAVLGQVTANGVYVFSDATATDGSEIPDAILAEAVDASATPIQAHIYLAGEFNSAQLHFAPSHSFNAVKAVFRARSLFLRSTQA